MSVEQSIIVQDKDIRKSAVQALHSGGLTIQTRTQLGPEPFENELRPGEYLITVAKVHFKAGNAHAIYAPADLPAREHQRIATGVMSLLSPAWAHMQTTTRPCHHAAHGDCRVAGVSAYAGDFMASLAEQALAQATLDAPATDPRRAGHEVKAGEIA